MTTHSDEDGRPCAHHGAPTTESLLALALVGSRASSFHHDLASKLQGMMMALDEIIELAGTDAALSRAVDGAQDSLREILALLNANRALTKPPARTRLTLPELFSRGCQRIYVTMSGPLPDVEVEVPVPALTHALALAIDIAAGPGRGRRLVVDASATETDAVVRLAASPEPLANAPEALTLAAFVIAREGGELRCAADGSQIVIRLPVAR